MTTQELFELTMENYDRMLEEGTISEDEYNELRANTFVEKQIREADEYGIELEDEESDYDGDYSSNMNLAEFSTGNRFGSALLELGQVAGYEDIEEYVIDLANVTGVDPVDIADCIAGEIEPDDDFTVAVAEAMELPENYAVDLLAAAYEARGEDLYELLDNDVELEEDEEYEDDEDPAVYSRLGQLESRLVEFEVAEAVRNRLANIEDLVDQGLQERWLTPNKAHQILGDFNREEDRVAAFSQMASANGVDLETQLYALEYALNLDSKSGAVVQFGAYSDENYEPTDEDRDILQQAKLNVLAAQNKFGK